MHGMTQQEQDALTLPVPIYEEWRLLRDDIFSSLEYSEDVSSLEDLELPDDEYVERLMQLLDEATRIQIGMN